MDHAVLPPPKPSLRLARQHSAEEVRMRVWFVPPIVIPILIVISLIGYTSLRALLFGGW